MSKQKTVADNGRVIIVCQGTGCVSSQSPLILEMLQKDIDAQGLTGTVRATFSGCHGCCEQGPIVIVEPEGIFYAQVKPADVNEIVESHLKNNQPVERLFYKDPNTKEAIPHYEDIPFYSKQQRIIKKFSGGIEVCKRSFKSIIPISRGLSTWRTCFGDTTFFTLSMTVRTWFINFCS